MKRKLTVLGIALACALTGFSQTVQRSSVRVEQKTTKIAKQMRMDDLNAAQSVGKKAVMSFKQTKVQVKAEGGELLNGTLVMKALNPLYQKNVEWNIKVTPDATDANKYWFDNLLGISSSETEMKPVYAILNDDMFEFPAGQVISEKIALEGGSFSDLTLARYDIQAGKLVPDFTNGVLAQVDEEAGCIYFDYMLGGLPDVGSALGVAVWSDATAYLTEYLPLDVAYTVPQGTLYYGMTYDGIAYWSALMACAASNATWTFNAVCEAASESAAYEWVYAKLGLENTLSATGKTMTIDAKVGDRYIFPILSVEDGKRSGIYSEGMNLFTDDNGLPLAVIDAGGKSEQVTTQDGTDAMINLSNANLDRQLTVERQNTGAYLYGSGDVTGKGNYLDAVISRYDKPQVPLTFTGVDVYCGVYENTNNAPLKLSIVKISEPNKDGSFNMLDVVAESTDFVVATQSADVDPDERTGIISLQFRNFTDKEGNSIVPVLNDHFALVLAGINQSGVKLGVASEAEYGVENYAYIMLTLDKQTMITNWQGMNAHLWMMLHECEYGELASSVETTVANQTSVFSTPDAFNFAYTEDFTSLEVYNVNGQKVSSYALPQTGSFSIAKSELADGVYLFRMNGKTSEVLRAVK